MKTELENQLLVKELENHGLVKNGKIMLDPSDIIALKRGHMTDPVDLKNVKGENGFEIDSVRARLSVVNDGNGKTLRKDPVYKKVQNHPLLEPREREQLVNGKAANVKKTTSIIGTILNFGKANYLFDEKEKPNFFIELSKYDGTSKTIWGVDLERALNDSSFEKGDKVQLNNLGSQKVEVDAAVRDANGKVISYEKKMVDRNMWEVIEPRPMTQNQAVFDKSHVIEYDPQTRQFMDYDPKKLKVPEQINGENLSAEKKRKLKEGEVITLADGTQVQIRTSDKNGLRSNRGFLVLSILMDGGLSYLLVTGIARLVGIKSQEDKSYSRGYIEALREVEKQLERKQRRFPKDASIANEINVVKQELNNASNMSHDELNDLSKKDADDITREKSVADPDDVKDITSKEKQKYTKDVYNDEGEIIHYADDVEIDEEEIMERYYESIDRWEADEEKRKQDKLNGVTKEETVDWGRMTPAERQEGSRKMQEEGHEQGFKEEYLSNEYEQKTTHKPDPIKRTQIGEEQHYKRGIDGENKHKEYHMDSKLEGDGEHVEQSRSRGR